MLNKDVEQQMLRIFRDAVAEHAAGLPENLVNSVMEYVFDRKRPRRFVQGLLTNDLALTVDQLKPNHRVGGIVVWLRFIHVAVPLHAQGSRETFEKWLDRESALDLPEDPAPPLLGAGEHPAAAPPAWGAVGPHLRKEVAS